MHNDEYALREYCATGDIPDYRQLVHEFTGMQKDLFEYAKSQVTEDEKLSPDELAEITSEFCRIHYDWIENVGKHALNRWLVYRCWQEGIST